MRVNSTRPAAVAGSWYPASPGALTRDVDGYVATVPAGAIPRGRLDAVIAPHAGLMFSGPVGAYAYKAAAEHGPYDALILAGPSHFVAFDGVALYPAGGVRLAARPRADRRSARRGAARGLAADSCPALRPHAGAFARNAAAVHPPPAAGRGDRPAAHGLPDARDDSRRSPRRWRRPSRSTRTSACCSWPAPISRTTSTRPPPRRSIAASQDCVAACDPERLLQTLRGVPRRGARTLRRVRRRTRDRGDAGGAGARRATRTRPEIHALRPDLRRQQRRRRLPRRRARYLQRTSVSE